MLGAGYFLCSVRLLNEKLIFNFIVTSKPHPYVPRHCKALKNKLINKHPMGCHCYSTPLRSYSTEPQLTDCLLPGSL